MDDYFFERLTPDHYKDLEYISNSAFGFVPPKDYYLSKNITSDFGETNIGFIAYFRETKEPAAFYGVYSYPLIYENKSFKIVQSGDTMTHKNHVGKGLFITLAKMTYELAKEKGAIAVFGFPNDNSYPGFVKKLNWKHRDNLKIYKIKVFTLPLLKLAKKIILFRGIYTAYFNLICNFFRPAKSYFENSTLGSDRSYIEHSKEYFQYKRFSGNMVIKINHVHVWIKPDGFLFIGDTEKHDTKNFKQFLRKLKLFGFLAGADIIQFGISPGSFLEPVLDKICQAERGAAFGYCMFREGFDLDKFIYTQADLDTF